MRAADTLRLHPDDDGSEIVLDSYQASVVAEYADLCDAVRGSDKRREQLKAGIVTQSAKKRASLVHKNETTDWMKSILSSRAVACRRCPARPK